MDINNADSWIEKLHLQAHPEGGFFREMFRSEETLTGMNLPDRYGGEQRSICTGIYYLLRSRDVSHLHRLASDEHWFFHTGENLTIHTISKTGVYEALPLGLDARKHALPHLTIPRGVWFGATVDEPDSFALVSCVVAPGFEFKDFELAGRQDLLKRCPGRSSLITRLTKA